MIRQWVYVFFRRGHTKLGTILVSLESTGPYQSNGEGLVFMHCVVLEIRLFFYLHTGLVTENYISEVHESRYCGLDTMSMRAMTDHQRLQIYWRDCLCKLHDKSTKKLNTLVKRKF